MNLVRLLKQTQMIGVAALILGSQGHAFNASLLHNDKELKTHAYNRIEKATAMRVAGATATAAFVVFLNTLNEVEKTQALCDLPVYQKFVGNLASAQLPNSPKAVLNFMIVWRSQNLIDDLLFEIIEQTSNLQAALNSTNITLGTNKEISRAEKILTSKEVAARDLKGLYESFSRASLNNPGCTTTEWARGSKDIEAVSNNKNILRLMNVAALKKGVITEEAYKLLEFYRINDVQSWDITLNKYLDVLKNSKNTARKTPAKDADFLPNSLSSQIKDKSTGTTYRQDLYYRFNATQIGMISDLLRDTFALMAPSTTTEVTFTMKDGSKTIPVSSMGQYFLARELLLKNMQELSRNRYFAGTQITHEDLVVAGLETGLINVNILDSALQIDDLWNPQVKPWTKISNYAMTVTGTASLFLPPPYNVISSIALVFINGFIAKKAAKTTQGGNLYDIF